MNAQCRLIRIQLVNWGTFNGGPFDILVPRSGLLLTGPSGSGKSSILDALAAVLVHPKWLSLNAAAQEGGSRDRSRTLATYVRGAYKRMTSEDSGEIAAAYLRTGATWSAIALTYDDQAGAVTTAVRLMHLAKGATAASDVRSLFVVISGALDVMELQPFAANGLDKRGLKRTHSDWFVADTYQQFASQLHRRLGLSDQAQHLLHKTQSAKNLDSLDGLLRDFMLDEPKTFELADQAIDQFQELRAAHATVVDARHQISKLDPLRRIDEDRRDRLKRREQTERLMVGVESMRLRTHCHLANIQLSQVDAQITALEPELQRADADAEARQRDHLEAEVTLRRAGGDRLETLEKERVQAQERISRLGRAREQAGLVAHNCGLDLPATSADMPDFLARVDQAKAQATETDQAKQARFDLAANHREARQRREKCEDELRLIEAEQSAMSPALLAVRDYLVEAGASRERLRFAGELLAVRPDEQRWTGAIERVLHGLARTLLVPEDLYPLVSDMVDQHRLVDRQGRGVRLVYERVPSGGRLAREDRVDGAASDNRYVWGKLTVEEGEFYDWLTDRLRRRFDYHCVESAAELRAVERGVTLAGQVRHSRSRHEKDDRFDVNDRLRWVLGSSGHARREALIEELARLRQFEGEALRLRDDAEAAKDEASQLRLALEQLSRVDWDSIDIETGERELAEVVERIRVVREASTGMAEAERAVERAATAMRQAQTVRDGLRDRLGALRAQNHGLTNDLARWRAELADQVELSEGVAAELGRRFSADPARVDLDANKLANEYRKRVADLSDQTSVLNSRAVRVMAEYSKEWVAESADLSPDLDYLPEYLTILSNLERDGLPGFEERFFRLLQTQTRNNVGAIAQTIRNSRREVGERIGPINDSLEKTEYSKGHHLFLRVDDRRLPEVTQFLADLNAVTSGSLEDRWSDESSEEAHRLAEQRFVRLAGLLERLSSSDPVDRRWRITCLDTRQHVQFVAEERDVDGQPVNYYKDSGGLSGGERQKLVVFCLAAALRYQLAREGSAQPKYALVVLDEAFDKTDPTFTRLGLEVFQQFGFQLLLATPEKMLQTLEDYVGGVLLVRNDPGQGSGMEELIWDEPTDDERGAGDGSAAGADGRRPGGDVTSVSGGAPTSASVGQDDLFSVGEVN